MNYSAADTARRHATGGAILHRLLIAATTLAILACGFVVPSAAEGFARTDLTKIEADPNAFRGGDFMVRAAPERLSVLCLACTNLTAVDVLIGRSLDGTEGRYRSGETTIEQMEELCRSRDPSCRMSAAKVGDAVGWQSTWQVGSMAGSTVVLFRDGDLLTIRSIAGDPQTAKQNADVARRTMAPQIVGR